jgi:acetylornithine/succinyldiaminopimelate/putrescine aminotransferase
MPPRWVGASLQRLRAGLAGLAGVVEIRGQGLMLGIELDRPCGVLLSSVRWTPGCCSASPPTAWCACCRR